MRFRGGRGEVGVWGGNVPSINAYRALLKGLMIGENRINSSSAYA